MILYIAKLKQQAKEESEKSEGGRGGKVSLHQMKKERDYRRRRQTYRARNVHITRRTPAQVYMYSTAPCCCGESFVFGLAW